MWKKTYMYYEKEQANRVFSSLKRDGIKTKMTKRKLAKWETERPYAKGSRYVYSIYTWRL